MPGPDVLDEPLNEALLILKAHKTLPRARLDTGDILPAAKPVRQPSESSTSTQLRVRTKGPLGSPILLTGDSALPPTPPSNSRERQDHYNVPLSGPSQDAGVMTSLASKGSGLSTPTNGRSPPTPDITPPSAAISHLRNPLPSPFTSLSSRTQSFQTAREEQWNSDDDLDSMNTRSDPYQTSTRAYVEATNALRYGDRGLGFIFEREDNDLTPTPELTRPLNVQIPSPELHVPIASPKLNGVGRQLDSRRVVSDGSVPARKALDANAMRNVTQHREKRSRTPPRQQQTPPNVDEGKRDLPFEKLESPKSVQSQRQITLTPPMDVTTSRTVSAASHVLNGSLSDMGTKRLSGVSNMSNTSTVIEAIIRIATPPSAGRSLRHVNKYRGLRNFSGSSIDMSSVSSISHSNRTSLNSVDGLPRKLSHKRGSIREKRDRDSLGSETDNTVVSSELRRPLKHHRDYSHVSVALAIGFITNCQD